MNWNDLRVFLALMRSGTFAGAARALGVNATTAARRLEALEQALGSQLFSRTPDGLVPTAAAEPIVAQAEAIERQAQLIESAAGGADAKLAGHVKLAVTEHFASSFLLRHLGAFRRAHSAIDVELIASDALVDLARGEADIALRFRRRDSGPGEPAGQVEVIARRVADIAVSVCASRDYLARVGCPADADDVDGHDIVLPREGAGYLPGSAWAARAQQRAPATLRSNGIDTIGAAAAAGFGLCALPAVVAMRWDNLMFIGEPVDWRVLWLMMPGDLRRVSRVRALWDFLIGLFETWGSLLSGEALPPQRRAGGPISSHRPEPGRA